MSGPLDLFAPPPVPDRCGVLRTGQRVMVRIGLHSALPGTISRFQGGRVLVALDDKTYAIAHPLSVRAAEEMTNHARQEVHRG